MLRRSVAIAGQLMCDSVGTIVGAGAEATLWSCALFACRTPVHYLVRRGPG
jgi:hypothetical protein